MEQATKVILIVVGLSFVAGLTVRPKGSVAVITAATEPFKTAIKGASGYYSKSGS